MLIIIFFKILPYQLLSCLEVWICVYSILMCKPDFLYLHGIPWLYFLLLYSRIIGFSLKRPLGVLSGKLTFLKELRPKRGQDCFRLAQPGMHREEDGHQTSGFHGKPMNHIGLLYQLKPVELAQRNLLGSPFIDLFEIKAYAYGTFSWQVSPWDEKEWMAYQRQEMEKLGLTANHAPVINNVG